MNGRIFFINRFGISGDGFELTKVNAESKVVDCSVASSHFQRQNINIWYYGGKHLFGSKQSKVVSENMLKRGQDIT